MTFVSAADQVTAFDGVFAQRALAAAPDWSGGTRIGEALKAFNDGFGRRGLARGAVVVIVSDGWERDDPAPLAREMERLTRLAHRIVWVNPRRAAPGYAPLVGGMAAALPFCDAFLSGHSAAAIDEVLHEIGAAYGRRCPSKIPNGALRPLAFGQRCPGTSASLPGGGWVGSVPPFPSQRHEKDH